MKINDYVSDLTKREGGKKSVDVAQMSEILKKVNGDLWGIPYLLVYLKRGLSSKVLVGFVIGLLFMMMFFAGRALSAEEGCGGNNRPVAVIEVRKA